jgi:tryptophan synthase beta subunit
MKNLVKGSFGSFGGSYLPPELEAVLSNLAKEYESLKDNKNFFYACARRDDGAFSA